MKGKKRKTKTHKIKKRSLIVFPAITWRWLLWHKHRQNYCFFRPPPTGAIGLRQFVFEGSRKYYYFFPSLIYRSRKNILNSFSLRFCITLFPQCSHIQFQAWFLGLKMTVSSDVESSQNSLLCGCCKFGSKKRRMNETVSQPFSSL